MKWKQASKQEVRKQASKQEVRKQDLLELVIELRGRLPKQFANQKSSVWVSGFGLEEIIVRLGAERLITFGGYHR